MSHPTAPVITHPSADLPAGPPPAPAGRHGGPGGPGRLTAQDTDNFRTLLARLESSLEADRRAAAQQGGPR